MQPSRETLKQTHIEIDQDRVVGTKGMWMMSVLSRLMKTSFYTDKEITQTNHVIAEAKRKQRARRTIAGTGEETC